MSEAINVKKTIEADNEQLFSAMLAGIQALGLSYDVRMRWRGGYPGWQITIYIPEAERDDTDE